MPLTDDDLDVAIGLVREELARQDSKWGADRNLAPRTWLTILMEEVGESAKADLEHSTSNYVEELVQVAAVAIAAVKCKMRHSRRERLRSKGGPDENLLTNDDKRRLSHAYKRHYDDMLLRASWQARRAVESSLLDMFGDDERTRVAITERITDDIKERIERYRRRVERNYRRGIGIPPIPARGVNMPAKRLRSDEYLCENSCDVCKGKDHHWVQQVTHNGKFKNFSTAPASWRTLGPANRLWSCLHCASTMQVLWGEEPPHGFCDGPNAWAAATPLALVGVRVRADGRQRIRCFDCGEIYDFADGVVVEQAGWTGVHRPAHGRWWAGRCRDCSKKGEKSVARYTKTQRAKCRSCSKTASFIDVNGPHEWTDTKPLAQSLGEHTGLCEECSAVGDAYVIRCENCNGVTTYPGHIDPQQLGWRGLYRDQGDGCTHQGCCPRCSGESPPAAQSAERPPPTEAARPEFPPAAENWSLPVDRARKGGKDFIDELCGEMAIWRNTCHSLDHRVSAIERAENIFDARLSALERDIKRIGSELHQAPWVNAGMSEGLRDYADKLVRELKVQLLHRINDLQQQMPPAIREGDPVYWLDPSTIRIRGLPASRVGVPVHCTVHLQSLENPPNREGEPEATSVSKGTPDIRHEAEIQGEESLAKPYPPELRDPGKGSNEGVCADGEALPDAST